jgi:TPR repeat protein
VTTASEEAASMLETQYTRASELFDAGEVKKAHEILTVLSERDYAPAQAFLGWLCQRGEGAASDATEARRLYEAAAAGGHAVGHYGGSFECRGSAFGSSGRSGAT